MENVSYVKIWNQIMDEFFNELIQISPPECTSKIKVQYNSFQLLCSSNKKKPCTSFMNKSIPFLEKIAMKDEQFFLSKDKPRLLNEIEIERIWSSPTFTDNSKEAIWKYIKTFFSIGINIVEMPTESMPLINFIINN